MIELKKFYNDGFGWICRRCADAGAEKVPPGDEKHSRLLREGESESKNPRLSNAALARWADNTRQTLVCPRCAATEAVAGKN